MNPLAPWAEWERPEVGLSFENWITEIHASLTSAYVESIAAPMTEVLVTGGVDAAVARYRQLKIAEPNGWRFGQPELNVLGYQLLARERFDDAITIFKQSFSDKMPTTRLSSSTTGAPESFFLSSVSMDIIGL